LTRSAETLHWLSAFLGAVITRFSSLVIEGLPLTSKCTKWGGLRPTPSFSYLTLYKCHYHCDASRSPMVGAPPGWVSRSTFGPHTGRDGLPRVYRESPWEALFYDFRTRHPTPTCSAGVVPVRTYCIVT
jgi:hypothetical protein